MFNPSKASKNIKDEYIDYIATNYKFRDKDLQDQLIEELKKSISKGPFLEINDVFKSGKSLNELIDEGVLSPLYRDLESKKPNSKLYKHKLPLDRKLYLHQEQAIRTIVSGNNAVVSTGTGSGKTNCFLIPVINELLREKEDNTLCPGVRAIFIYPMNALANDQMKNIREILMYYPDITFGVYNGGTENGEEKANAVYEAMYAKEKIEELRKGLPNEILSRDEMKKTPPNILFTNYAMLEHLLFRPKDDVLFSNADFRFVVLDEAHIYTGATGIETSILLRRLKARISSTKKTQFILTSATLGNDKSSDGDIIKFAQNLCGEEFKIENIIRATREIYNNLENKKDYPEQLYIDLADESNIVKDILDKYKVPYDDKETENELIYDVLLSSNLYDLFRSRFSKICSLNELTEGLEISLETALAFVSLCTKAKKNGKALLDARYHFFVKSLEGCYITLSENKKLFLTRQEDYFIDNKQYAVFEVAHCSDCGRIALVGKIEGRKLKQTSKLSDECEYFYLAEDYNNEIIDDEETEDVNNTKEKEYYLCPYCGAIVPVDEKYNLPCDCGKGNYIKVVKGNKTNTGVRCGTCHLGRYKRFYLGNEAATSVLATALYEELPEIEYEEAESKVITNNIFGASVAKKKSQKRTGRQFLVFSDSRQEAAKFACYLGNIYDEFLRRRGICQIIQEQKEYIINQTYTISDFVTKLTNYFTNKKTFAKSNKDESNLTVRSNENAWVAVLNELARFQSKTSLTALGQIQFEYLGNSADIVNIVAKQYNVSKTTAKDLLDLLIYEIVKVGAICTDNDTDINDNDREYIFYSPSQKFIKYMKEPNSKDSSIHEFAPKQKKNGRYYNTNKLYYVKRALKISDDEAAEFLKQYFDYLTKPEYGNQYCLRDINRNDSYVIKASSFRVKINGDETVHWYKCRKCGRITQFYLDGKCTSVKCEGKLDCIGPIEIYKGNHFANLYFSDRMSPLFIKEHTAQLSKKESAEYQEQFIKKEINALSCSTTFEMGVDVGDLETVFLRDVPPLPSNYAQRAGRAGRSAEAAAYALTFAKLSSHDLSFFKEPELMIKGTILPPLFKIDNEKIVRRHIYAVALSMFFAEHEDLYNNNDAHKFIDEKGYIKFIDWINMHPERLKLLLQKSIPDIDNLHDRIGINDFTWIEDFSGEKGVFTQLINEYEENVKNFNEIIEKFKNENISKAASCKRKLDNYTTNKLIEFLARGNILPRYGFPVDTVELYQNSTAGNIEKLRLSRDLQIAIGEYAPSSEVVADGRMYTSRYIKKAAMGNNKMDWYTGYIAVCDNKDCKNVNFSIVPPGKDGIPCVACGKKLRAMSFMESIEPRSGFVAERESKDVPMTKQEKVYRSEDYYIGNTASRTIEKYNFSFNGIKIMLESTTNDSLLVKSTMDFYVCPVCGYALAADEKIGNRAIEKQMSRKAFFIETDKAHLSLFGDYNCQSKRLDRRSLHHRFNTDVAKITFDCDTSDYDTMISVMYAIINAMSKDLNIERRDIKGCLSSKMIKNRLEYSIIIYDSVPGGAGHSRRLVTKDGKMLYSILQSAYNNMMACNCKPSCYTCLRCYENQNIHEKLNRLLAAKFLKQFDGEIIPIELDNKKENGPIKLDENFDSDYNTKKLIIKEKALEMKNEEYDYIFSQLDDSKNIIDVLCEKFKKDKLEKPDYNETEFIVEDKEGYSDLIWLDKKIMLFSKSNVDSYNLAKQSDYSCYILNDDFDIDRFIEEFKLKDK